MERTFSLREIIEAVNEEYPDGHLATMVDINGVLTKKARKGECGDTLALYIVSELNELGTVTGNTVERLRTMIKALELAEGELRDARAALDRLITRAEAECGGHEWRG